MSATTIISGLNEIETKIKTIVKTISPKSQKRREAALLAAEKIADRLEAAAPKGPTGNLKAAMRAGKAKMNIASYDAWSAIDRKAKEKGGHGAPHAHLVERGTGPRYHQAGDGSFFAIRRRGKSIWTAGNGEARYKGGTRYWRAGQRKFKAPGHPTGKMRANAFFRRTIASAGKELDIINTEIAKEMQAVWR